MKVAELEGSLLDYWVAQVVGESVYWDSVIPYTLYSANDGDTYRPSSNWEQGGPIIDRERIAIFSVAMPNSEKIEWGAEMRQHEEYWIDTSIYDCDQKGATPLEAAMRSFVMSKFGDEVDESGHL